MTERAIVIPNDDGQSLVGVYHDPGQAPRALLCLLHGWSGYRTGPHQMLVRAARHFCGQGYGVLRFDFAGRGDSDGDYELATLATMAADTRAALAWARHHAPARPLLVGLCSGCEILVAAVNDEVRGCILWSAPIFADLPSTATAAQKRNRNMQNYLRKLGSLATWRKLWRGEVNTAAVGKALAGGGGGAAKNVESNQPGQLPLGFRAAALCRWGQYRGPRLHVYGTADPIATAAADWYAARTGENRAGEKGDVHWIEGANHSFYGLEWEAQVLAATSDWLEQRDWNG